MFRLSRSYKNNKRENSPLTLCVRHQPDDGWYGQSKHVVVYNDRIMHWICMVVFGMVINTLLISNTQRNNVTQESN